MPHATSALKVSRTRPSFLRVCFTSLPQLVTAVPNSAALQLEVVGRLTQTAAMAGNDTSSSSPPPSASEARTRRTRSRPSRRARSHVVLPADSLLTFTRYQAHHDNHHFTSSHQVARSQPTPVRHRESFVQANCRFAVDPTFAPGYAAPSALPDAVVPWSAVDVVFVPRPSACPICLHDFRCPRITPCGHVFDYVCILQHILHAGSESGGAKCPICGSAFSEDDLKACSFPQMDELEVGLPCAMRLVSRERRSMIALPHVESHFGSIPKGIAESPFYSRFAFADETYLMQLNARFLDELRATQREEPDLVPFVRKAMETLKADRNRIRSRRSAARKEFFAMHQNSPNSDEAPRNQSGPQKDLCLFYQSRDAKQVFLHPVNHRCLRTEFGSSFDEAPFEIEGVVVEIERHTMAEQPRKRFRFLGHLPDGCEFAFVELDLTHMLSPQTLAEYDAELKQRRTARKRKEISMKQEDRAREKSQSAAMQEYLAAQTGRLLAVQQQEVVDGSDATSFPELPLQANGVEEPLQRDERTDTQIPELQRRAGEWGASVSSYSSVTSNMGLFPSLGQVRSGAPVEASQEHVMPPQSPTQPQGAWSSGSNAAKPTRSNISPSNDFRPRKGARGKTTILSNAGTPHRR